jgi:hypothetical protein
MNQDAAQDRIGPNNVGGDSLWAAFGFLCGYSQSKGY